MRCFIVLAVCLTAVLAAPKSLPANWPPCKKDDPKVAECVQNAISVAVKDLAAKGAKEFGVFPIDPLLISSIDIAQGTGPVSVELRFSDLQIFGLKNVRVAPLTTIDLDNFKFVVPVTIPEGVSVKGHYKVNGKVLVLPIKGEGACDLFLENVRNASVILQGKATTRNKVKYMEVESFDFNFEIDRLRIKLENLFNGNKQLSDQMNVFLNENWNEILKELKPAIQEAFGAAFGDITNRIFTKVSYNKIFGVE